LGFKIKDFLNALIYFLSKVNDALQELEDQSENLGHYLIKSIS